MGAEHTSWYIVFPGWLPFLMFYFYWLYKYKPHKQIKDFVFYRMKYIVKIKRW